MVVDWNQLVEPMEEFLWLVYYFKFILCDDFSSYIGLKQEQNIATPRMKWMFYLPSVHNFPV
jgi:hypothetical protein